MTVPDLPATPTMRAVEFPPRSNVEAGCGNCRNFRTKPDTNGLGDCRLNPPETHVLLIPEQKLPAGLVPGAAMQGPQMMPIATWPLVQPDQWCAKHDWTEGSRDELN